ncbi:hypothetical protein ACQJBY_048794 [Aegilops geniculata]
MRASAPLAVAGIPFEPVDLRKMETMDDGKEQRLARGDLVEADGQQRPPSRLLLVDRESDNGRDTAAGEEIIIWKIAVEEEDGAGRSIEQEFQTQVTPRTSASEKMRGRSAREGSGGRRAGGRGRGLWACGMQKPPVAPTVDIPVMCYQILGVTGKANKEDVVKLVIELKKTEMEDGYME